MASLEVSQIEDLIKNPKNQDLINDAAAYEERLRMHTVSYTSEPNNSAYSEWLYWMNCTLDSEKYDLFSSSIKFPLKTVPLYTKIYDSLSKVFDANDANKDVFFSDNFNDEKELFRSDLDNISGYWENKGYKQLQYYPCSFIVIDFPKEEKKAEPLHFFVGLESIVSCELKEDNVTPEHFIYKIDESTIVAIDDDVRRVFREFKEGWLYDNEIGDIPNLTKGIPVRSFISTVIDENPFKKGVPSVASTLGNAEWYLTNAIGQDTQTLNALWPTQWEYGEDENTDSFGRPKVYEYNEERGCNTNQYNRTKEEERDISRRFVGSILLKPLPNTDTPDIGDPMGWVTTPVESLEEIESDIQRRKSLIYETATGLEGGDSIDKQALNADQVAALSQGHQVVLQRLANDLSKSEKWTIDTMGRVRFGEAYEGSVINNGTTFIIFTPNQIEESIKKGKESGLNEAQLKTLYFMWYDSKFKTEPLQAEKYKILFDVEPFPTHSFQEMQANYDNGFISSIDWNVKINFNNYVSRFENEFVKITAISDDKTTEEKVSFIRSIIYNYGTEAENKSANRNREQSINGVVENKGQHE